MTIFNFSVAQVETIRKERKVKQLQIYADMHTCVCVWFSPQNMLHPDGYHA